MFVTFEGIEGSGKSTLIAAVERSLKAAGSEVLLAREPGGTPAGDAVRRIFLQPGLSIDAMTEVMLINASRAQLVASVLRPAVNRGRYVLCDRYVDSTLAYQGYGRGLAIDAVRAVCDAATGGLKPDLTLLLDVPVETSIRRLASRQNGADRLEREGRPFHERVRRGFLDLAGRSPQIVVLNGERSPDEVLDAAMAAIGAAISGAPSE